VKFFFGLNKIDLIWPSIAQAGENESKMVFLILLIGFAFLHLFGFS